MTESFNLQIYITTESSIHQDLHHNHHLHHHRVLSMGTQMT